MTTLAFPHQVPFADPSVPAGGCELGQGRCMNAAEVEVTCPETRSVRLLCREHVGYYMLAAAGATRSCVVEVRRVDRVA